MRSDVKRDLSNSAYDFKRLVWPVISTFMRGGDIVPVESVFDDTFTATFDMLAGIDAWQLATSEGAMRGIASRIQYGSAWASFTIRESRSSGAVTEYEKRRQAIKDKEGGWLYPTLTVQAYITQPRTGDLRHVCVARTKDIYDFLETAEEGFDYEYRENPSDGNRFIVVWWPALKASGKTVKTFTAPGVNPNMPSQWITPTPPVEYERVSTPFIPFTP